MVARLSNCTLLIATVHNNKCNRFKNWRQENSTRTASAHYAKYRAPIMQNSYDESYPATTKIPSIEFLCLHHNPHLHQNLRRCWSHIPPRQTCHQNFSTTFSVIRQTNAHTHSIVHTHSVLTVIFQVNLG